MTPTTITATQLSEICRSGRPIELIDVRTPAEFREVHVTAARNVPLDRLDPGELKSARNGAVGPLYVICKSGGRAAKACEQLINAGITNVVNVEGGTAACVDAGVPVVRGKKTISLERQVRIAAGSLVLLGVIASFWYFPMIGLSAFVGAGLIFAGVTDTCGMGMLLARMPWNK